MQTSTHVWPGPILEGRFLRRYKRFFADIHLGGEKGDETGCETGGEAVVAHVANTGSLKSCLYEGGRALILGNSNPLRKLKYSLQALETPWGAWIGVNTQWPNTLVQRAFAEKAVAHWNSFSHFKSEHKISKETRLDALLTSADGQRQLFVEVKNVTLAEGDCAAFKGTALFPDAVTERGQKHLRELTELVRAGHEAEMVFVVQRADCVTFKVAENIDPDYAAAVKAAVAAGVRVTVWPVHLGPEGLRLRPDRPLNFAL